VISNMKRIQEEQMNRVYILMNVREGTAERVVDTLRLISGVLMADITGRHPDITMVIQASNQANLTRLTIDAL
jgi:hypothetical protein